MAYRNYATAVSHIVDSTGQGDFTTITTALAAAVSGQTIFLRPGTYTENITLVAGVNITAFPCDGYTPNVTILGTCTLTTAGTVTISGINLKTNSAYCLVVSGSAASIVNLVNCHIDCNNNSAINYTSSSSSSAINLYSCTGDVDTTGITPWVNTGVGTFTLQNCKWENNGNSTTQSTSSSGTTKIFNSIFKFPISMTGSQINSMYNSQIDCGATNVTPFTTTTSGTHSIYNSTFTGGSASAMTIGASTTVNLWNSTIFSSATNAISNSGTLNYAGISFAGTSSLINGGTQVGGVLQGGRYQAPSAGFIGERISSAVAKGSGVSYGGTSNLINMTSISLTAGVWDISVNFAVTGATTATYWIGGISANSASFTGTASGDSASQWPITSTSAGDYQFCIAPFRVVLTATTTYYAVTEIGFTVGSPLAYGRLSAVRVG